MPGKKLLVADDSLTIQKVIRLALSNEGYDIQAVSDGNDAVQQISLFRPDIVLIDVSLPGKSAFEVKREINTLDDLEEVRFVLMSSAFEKVDEAQVEEVNFHGRLTKPFDPAHLRQVLTDVVNQVVAKRMEKTSILNRPTSDALPPLPGAPPLPGSPPPLPGFVESNRISPPSFPGSSPPPPSLESDFQPPELPEVDSEFQMESEDSSISLSEEEDWANGIQPENDLPSIAQDSSLEPVENLWEPGEEPSDVAIPMPPPLTSKPPVVPPPMNHMTSSMQPNIPPSIPHSTPPPMPPSPPMEDDAFSISSDSNESDIKQLTESTLRGVKSEDDFQWSVTEPTLKPMPSMMDSSGTNFELDGSPDDLPQFGLDHGNTPPSLPPLPNNNFSSDMYSIGEPEGSDPKIFAPPSPPETGSLHPKELFEKNFQAVPPPPAFPEDAETSPPGQHPHSENYARASSDTFTRTAQGMIEISESQLEAMVKSQVQATIEKLAQKILPEVAEKIIKQEIHRLLSEQ